MQLSPAEYVVHVFGGVSCTARAIGRTPQAVTLWRTQAGGRVPGTAQKLILLAARKRKLDITPNDLIVGRRVRRTK